MSLSPSEGRSTWVLVPGCACADHSPPIPANCSASSGPIGTDRKSPRITIRRPPVVNIANSSPVPAVSAARSFDPNVLFGTIAPDPYSGSCPNTRRCCLLRQPSPPKPPRYSPVANFPVISCDLKSAIEATVRGLSSWPHGACSCVASVVSQSIK